MLLIPIVLYWPGPSFYVGYLWYIPVLRFGVGCPAAHSIRQIDVIVVAVFVCFVSTWPRLDLGLLLVDDALFLIAAETPTAVFIMILLEFALEFVAVWRGHLVVDCQIDFLPIAEGGCSVRHAALHIVELVAAG